MKKLYFGIAVIIALGISSLIFFGVITFSNFVTVPLLIFAGEHTALLNLGTILSLFILVIFLVRTNRRKRKNKGI